MTNAMTRMQAILLGVLVLLALALGGVGLFAVADREGLWGEHFILNARFKQVNGIDVGTGVRVQGMNAGQVVAIDLPDERGGEVLVRMKLKGRFQKLIGGDARVEILGEGLIGGKVVEIDPGTPGASPIQTGAVLPGRSDNVMTELKNLASKSNALMDEVQALTRQTTKFMAEAQGLVAEVRKGEGVMGRELLVTLRDSQETMDSVSRGFDALKRMPLVGRYVDSSAQLLIRPNMERHAFVFKEEELFAADQALLTAEGRKRLDALANDRLGGFKVAGSEIIVAAYTDATDARAAEIVTRHQSDAVRDYLVDEHKANKVSWWRRRTVTPLAMGNRQPPGQPTMPIAAARRIEVIVFVPPGSTK